MAYLSARLLNESICLLKKSIRPGYDFALFLDDFEYVISLSNLIFATITILN